MAFDFSQIKVSDPSRLHFGTGGIPLSTTQRSTLNGIKQIHTLGLDALEMEFVHSVNLNDETAASLYALPSRSDTVLTCHGSYYINLNALEGVKRGASRSRILQAADMCRKAGGWSVVFHAAYYMKLKESTVYATVKKQMTKLISELKDKGNGIWIRPETTGKVSQFGTLPEIIKLSQELDQVMPCVDFAHMHARSNGQENTVEEFRGSLGLIEKGLGKEGLHNMHIHMSGIEYGEKGEKKHLVLEDSDFNYSDLIETWKEFKIKGVVVSESPNLEQDALLMKKLYDTV